MCWMWLVGTRERTGLCYSAGARAWLNCCSLQSCDLPFPRTNSTSTFLANGIKRHASLPSICWPLPSTKEANILCSRLAACPRSCAVSLRLSSCLEHLLTALSSCFQSSNKYPPLHTLSVCLASANIHNATVSLSTVHAPRQTLSIPRPSYPCSPRAPASLVRLHPLVHHTHSCPPPI